jgi:hypothetical protein
MSYLKSLYINATYPLYESSENYGKSKAIFFIDDKITPSLFLLSYFYRHKDDPQVDIPDLTKISALDFKKGGLVDLIKCPITGKCYPIALAEINEENYSIEILFETK